MLLSPTFPTLLQVLARFTVSLHDFVGDLSLHNKFFTLEIGSPQKEKALVDFLIFAGTKMWRIQGEKNTHFVIFAGDIKNKAGVALYKNVAWPVISMMNPEVSHNFSVWLAKTGLTPVDHVPDDPVLKTTFLGKTFSTCC